MVTASDITLPENKAPRVTVFTPAYNREKLLGRVFESLQAQSSRDFEWLVVDDGSSDGTRELIESWIEKADFPIRYIWKENGGKHTALNRGIAEASGEFFLVVDSDDWLLPNGIETLLGEWEKIEFSQGYVGVCGLFEYPDGKLVGTEFPEERFRSNAIELRLCHRVKGDKIALNRLEILRKFPFPEDLSHTMLPESVVWNRIAQDYDTLFVNRRIAVKEYQEGGLTDGSILNSFRNPLAYRTKAIELLNGRREIGASETARAALAVAKCSLRSGSSPWAVDSLGHKILVTLALPFGGLLLFRDSLRSRAIKKA